MWDNTWERRLNPQHQSHRGAPRYVTQKTRLWQLLYTLKPTYLRSVKPLWITNLSVSLLLLLSFLSCSSLSFKLTHARTHARYALIHKCVRWSPVLACDGFEHGARRQIWNKTLQHGLNKVFFLRETPKQFLQVSFASFCSTSNRFLHAVRASSESVSLLL